MDSKISRFNIKVGQWVSWLNLALVLLTVGIVILRYVFDLGWVALQEVVLYIHATIFMLAGAYTLAKDQHVRVDILSAQFSKKRQLWLQRFGVVAFLFPFCAVMLYYSYSYVLESWRVRESSGDAGGLPGVFLLKSLLLIYPLLLVIQGFSMLRFRAENSTKEKSGE